MTQPKVILCVDDEASVLTIQKMLLEAAGFRVLTAHSGKDGIRIFQGQEVDLVLMDYAMPGMDGISAARMMKQIKPEVPIVFLSAYHELPGETLGIGQGWVKKGEEEPERFIARLRSIVGESGACKACSLAS